MHRHRWVDERNVFTPPRPITKATAWGDDWADGLQRLVYGFTTFVQRCDACGITRTHNAPGDVR